jgi:hypothetical protein
VLPPSSIQGLESVVFLFGVGNTQPLAIPISGLIGITCGIMVGVVLYYTGRTIKDIKVMTCLPVSKRVIGHGNA